MINRCRNLLAFGSGDIDILLGAEEGKATLIFKNKSQPEPIGNMTIYQKNTVDYVIEAGDVVMTFSCPESIDAMIHALQTVRNNAFPDQH